MDGTIPDYERFERRQLANDRDKERTAALRFDESVAHDLVEDLRAEGVIDVEDDTERSKREVEAEAVVYVVGCYCGLDTSESAFYLAAWESDDPDVVRSLTLASESTEPIIDCLVIGAFRSST